MSAHNHNTEDVQVLYEGDQSKLYSGVLSHHKGESVESAGSKKQVSKLIKVTIILTIITAVEVLLGLTGHAAGIPHWLDVTLFLIMTVLKAAYIVKVFMHLGDEVKNMVLTVLIPLVLFIWFILAFLADGHFWLHMNTTNIAR